MGKIININGFGERLSQFINQSHRDVSQESLKASLNEIFKSEGIDNSNFALIVLAIKENGVSVETNDANSYISKASQSLIKKEDRKKFREKYHREPEHEEDLKKADNPKISIFIDKHKLKLLESLAKIMEAIAEILASYGLSEYAQKPITSFTKYDLDLPVKIDGLEGKTLVEGLAEMISSEKPSQDKNGKTESEKIEDDEKRKQTGELDQNTPESEREKSDEAKKAEAKKKEEAKKAKKTSTSVPTNIEVLKERFSRLDILHEDIIRTFTTSHFEPDVRARIVREFGANVLELKTLCINDGSYDAKELINLCKNLENTVECVGMHPEQYHGMTVEKITDVLHKADAADYSGSSKTFADGHGDHPEIFGEDHEHEHDFTTDGEVHEHGEHSHTDTHSGLLEDENHGHEHDNKEGHKQENSGNGLTEDILQKIEDWGVEGIKTLADWIEFTRSEEYELIQQSQSMSFTKHDDDDSN